MQVVIVTGASSGLGREFVKQMGFFYKNLDEIWVIARRKERLEELQKESKVPLRIFCGDLTKKTVYVDLKKTLEKEKPDVKMLVNAAGFGKSGTVETLLEENYASQMKMLDLNCSALTRMTLFVLPYLSVGSRIIQIASAAAFCPQPGFSVYAATKSYVLSFSRSLGAELKKRGVVVTAVCPGPVDTEFFDVSGDIGSWKSLVMAKAPYVVKQALLDSRDGKALSVYGMPMKVMRILSKIVPTSWILAVERVLLL